MDHARGIHEAGRDDAGSARRCLADMNRQEPHYCVRRLSALYYHLLFTYNTPTYYKKTAD